MSCNLAVITIHKGSIKKLFYTIKSIDEQCVKPDLHLIITKNYFTIKHREKYRKYIFNKDHSIYNAMNIGQFLIKGMHYMFLNSGDKFSKKTSVKLIKKTINNNKQKCIIFKTILQYKNLKFFPKSNYFYSSQFKQHPSFICPNRIKKIKFNQHFKIVSDGIWMSQNILKFGYLKINQDISIMNLGGISNNPTFNSIKEFFKLSLIAGFKEILKFCLRMILDKKDYYKFLYKKNYYLYEAN